MAITIQKQNDRLFVRIPAGEILALPIRHLPRSEKHGLGEMLIEAAWEMAKLYKPEKTEGISADKAQVQHISEDGKDRFEVVFYPASTI